MKSGSLVRLKNESGPVMVLDEILYNKDPETGIILETVVRCIWFEKSPLDAYNLKAIHVHIDSVEEVPSDKNGNIN